MNFKMILLLLPIMGFSLSASAVLPIPYDQPLLAAFAGVDTYRIGDVWGKQEISDSDMAGLPSLDRIAHATARVGGATGFVIGKFGGEWVIATNYHVCTYDYSCEGGTARFDKGQLRITIKQFLHSWSEIDLALLTLDVKPNSAEEKYLAQYASNFDYNLKWSAGQELVTAGFGVAGNSNRALVGNWDADCRIFSQPGDFRFLADPDALNPADYSVWSISVGCDASHGDSGSSMVDRATGKVVGIIWTGKFPKAANIQSSDYLNKILVANSEEIWQELNLVVPAQSIQSVIQATVLNENLGSQVEMILTEVAL